jgi:WD40 repeat protein
MPRRIRRTLVTVTAAVLALLPLGSRPLRAALTDPALKWKTIKTEHFAFNYYEGEEDVVKRLAAMAEDVYRDVTTKFDAYPKGRTQIVVVDNNDLANGFTLVIPYNLILLRAVPPFADSTLDDYDDWLHELLTHEFTHVVHISDTRWPAKLLKLAFGKLMAPNGLTPGWVTEGMAVYDESEFTTRGRGRSSFTDMLLRTDILNDRFLHLDQMAGTQYDWPAWQAQYLYGIGFWKFLADKYGEDKMVDFSHHYGASLRFFMLNSQAKRSYRKELTPEEKERCAEKYHDTEGPYGTRVPPETCGPDRGQSFYKLWDEWKADLTQRYGAVRDSVTKSGLKEGDTYLAPAKGESFSLPTISPDGKQLAYMANSVDYRTQLRIKDLNTGKDRVLIKGRDIQQLAFSQDGEKLLVSYLASYKRYNEFSDLFEIDLKTGKMKQITHGERARDPDANHAGKIVASIQKTGHGELGVYDPATKQWKTVFKADQFDHPRWMPNGQDVVVSVHKDKQRDLWIIDTETGEGHKITDDVAVEDRPMVDRDLRVVYYSSDKSGIPNIYRYDPYTKSTKAMTNVLTGAFSPSLGPDGSLLYQYYNGRGFEVRKIARGTATPPEVKQGTEMKPAGPIKLFDDSSVSLEGAKPYSPFPKLLIPRYIMPNFSFVDNAVFLSATLSNYDPLYRHFWFGDVTYRTDNNFVGFDLGYTYSRYRPAFSVGISDFTVNYGDVFRLGTNFYEERRRAYGGVSVPIGVGYSHLSLQYFFEDRSAQSGLPAGTTLTTLGHYAGLYGLYSYIRTQGTAAGISPEKGERFLFGVEGTNSIFGASDHLEQIVIGGDFRKYILMPYSKHHVIALRAAGGAAFGDKLLQGNFTLGGSLGESFITAASTRLFTLRGLPLATFARDRAWVASVEYRLPLYSVERGLGTTPFALNNMHLDFFADVGDAFNNPSFRPLLGLGAEIRGDFIIGYHLPLMGRLGYGIIVTNRDRIVGVKDSLTGADARNGVVILELGTSF